MLEEIIEQEKYVKDCAENLVDNLKVNVGWVSKALNNPDEAENLAITINNELELTDDVKEVARKFAKEKVETIEDVLRIYNDKTYYFINSGGGMGNDGDISFEVHQYQEELVELKEMKKEYEAA